MTTDYDAPYDPTLEAHHVATVTDLPITLHGQEVPVVMLGDDPLTAAADVARSTYAFVRADLARLRAERAEINARIKVLVHEESRWERIVRILEAAPPSEDPAALPLDE